jgi:hypothetical protein
MRVLNLSPQADEYQSHVAEPVAHHADRVNNLRIPDNVTLFAVHDEARVKPREV